MTTEQSLTVERFKVNLVRLSNLSQTSHPPDTRVTYSQCTTLCPSIEMLCFGRDHIKCINILWLPQCWNHVFLFANLWLITWVHTGKTTLGNKELQLQVHNKKMVNGYQFTHFVQDHAPLFFQGEHADSKTSLNTHQSANKKVSWT